MTPRRLILFGLVALSTMTVGACGDDDDDSGGNATPTPTATATEVASVTATPSPPPPPPPPPPPTEWSDSATHAGLDWGFKGCHGMSTQATLYRSSAKVYGSTSLWSHCELGGFTGQAGVLLINRHDVVIGKVMSPDTWGVNGKAERWLPGGGPNERWYEPWKASIADPDDVAIVNAIRAFDSWAPRNRLEDIINESIQQGRKATEVVGKIVALGNSL